MLKDRARLLMIFIKNPLPGRVKTRLAKDVGDEQALKYYRELLQITRKVALETRADRWLWYADFVNGNDEWDTRHFEKKLQQGSDLGDRMRTAFEEAFQEGYKKVIIIGSDCPEISGELLERAFSELEKNEVVIGPANDGGYYLLGMSAFYNFFEDISWSTGSVKTATVKKINEAGLEYTELPELTDLDTIEDLKKFSKL